MRTKQEVVDFLESKVGGGVECKGNPALDSQCVTLIKALMEFLGVPNPYKARGHAKTVITAYINDGIDDNGSGFISVFSNRDMGGGYGHVWCNAGEGNGTYYESNGVKPLTVTKGKSYLFDSICNFDKYIREENMADEKIYTEAEMTVVRETRDSNWNSYQEEKAKHKDTMELLVDAQDKLTECENKPVIPPKEDNIKWVVNGKTESFEVDGVKVTKNYTIQRGE